jgi:uncharacterized membrane protein
MEDLWNFMAAGWLAAALVIIGSVSLIGAWLWRRHETYSRCAAVVGGGLALAGGGGLMLPAAWSGWIVLGSAVCLFGQLLVLMVSGRWYAPLAWIAAGILCLGIGGSSVDGAQRVLTEGFRVLTHLEVAQPGWLVLLLLVPVIVLWSYRSLASLGRIRRWAAICLRASLVIFLTLALAELRLRRPDESLTVLFLVDRSLSVPEDWQPDPDYPGKRIDRRWERVKKFINQSVEKRGLAYKWDKAGVIVFGRRPRLELPPSDAPRLRFNEVTSPIDSNYTDIGGAIKLALASFPEGTAKRMVLISDGNENLGNAESQARIAKKNDVQIDVVPLAAGYKNESDVLVQAVEAPSLTEQSSQLPIRVLLRSYNQRSVLGTLTLRQVYGEHSIPVPPSPVPVKVRPGLNSFAFKQTLGQQQQSYTYEAIFQPKEILTDDDHVAEEFTNYRPENKRATTHVIAQGQRRILLVEAKAGDQQLLLDRLRALGGNSKFKIHSIEAQALPTDKADLAVFLSNYDCVILANVPADLLNDDQQEIIRSNTHEQGCGLIMVGGPESFGAGGWQGTPVEKALPVDCDIKALKVQGKGGLVLVMHASELADGNRWQKEIAKLAIKKLAPSDEVGVLFFDWGAMKWHIPLQEIGSKRDLLLKRVDSLAPGDMPDFDPGLEMALSALTDTNRELTTKHVIVISDGDPVQNRTDLLSKMRASKITVSTVGVATHGPAQDQALGTIAKMTGGRFYNVKSPKALPAIYIKETRLVSQAFVYEKRFQPRLIFKSGPTEKLPDQLSPLYGFVRTTPKASAFVQMPILGPASGEQDFPVLAYWNYGLGKSAAFTSDARSIPGRPGWDRDWASSEMYLKFWEQIVDWALRSVETGRLMMTTEYRDGKVRVIVDARDSQDRPMTDLEIRGGVTPPSTELLDGGKAAKATTLQFEQRNSGVYETEFKAEEAGSYFINAQAHRMVRTVQNGKEVVSDESDSVRSGITIPYSPEFADMESNAPLLEKVRAITGGNTIADDPTALAEASSAGEVFRRTGLPPSRNLQPVWQWLLLLTATLLFFDVAVRRIAIDASEVMTSSQRVWQRLRRQATLVPAAQQFLERLQSRKAQIDKSIDHERAGRRFEPGAEPAELPPGAAADASSSAPRAAPAPTKPQLAPEPKKEEPADFASRLMQAKKRVWEEREKG